MDSSPNSHIRVCHVLFFCDGDGILLNCRTSAANNAYESRSGDRRHAPKRSHTRLLSRLPGDLVNPFQSSRVRASSLRRVSALRGTLTSRSPISSLRPHTRLASCRSSRTDAGAAPRRSNDRQWTSLAHKQRGTTSRWKVSRIFSWGAGMHAPVRRVVAAGGRMFEFLFPPR